MKNIWNQIRYSEIRTITLHFVKIAQKEILKGLEKNQKIKNTEG